MINYLVKNKNINPNMCIKAEQCVYGDKLIARALMNDNQVKGFTMELTECKGLIRLYWSQLNSSLYTYSEA